MPVTVNAAVRTDMAPVVEALGAGVEDPEDPPDALELLALLFEFPLPEFPPLEFGRF